MTDVSQTREIFCAELHNRQLEQQWCFILGMSRRYWERVEHRKNKEQEVTLSELKANAATQGEIIGRQQKQIEAFTAGLQKLSVQLELSKPARGVGKAYSFQPEIISSAPGNSSGYNKS